jgi:hypothetical protein
MYGSAMIEQSASGHRWRPGSKPALAGAVTNLALAAGLGAIRATNGSVGERRAEGPLPTVALVVLLAAPGILALIGVATARPVLFGAAGIACLPLAIVSIAAVPIWLPGVLFVIAFVRATSSRCLGPTLAGCIFAGFGFTLVLFVALRLLVSGYARYTYDYPGGSEAGDYIRPAHAAWCILIVTADIFITALFARLSPAPRDAAPGRSASSQATS